MIMNPPPNNCPPLCGTHMDSEVDALKAERDELQRKLDFSENCKVLAVQQRDELRAVIAAHKDALLLVIPMAKGYAHTNSVGNNWRFVEQAEALALTPASGDKSARSEKGRTL